MPRIPASTPKAIARLLESRGFILDRIVGSHHVYRHAQTGRTVVVPFHKGDLPTGTLHMILKDAGISREEFLDG
ncbi:MAG: type II toxin-antitoxin system HicA family toxin [Chloroflexi bacterium]|nr:type II toxin-antitoxin system HicA family toxin [Chloroflexota bacterium]